MSNTNGTVNTKYAGQFEYNEDTYLARIGLAIPKSGTDAVNKYLYQGKEKQPEITTYDFGARMYDPTSARWNRPDRFSEKYYDLSPYSFAAGDPLMYTDVNGDSLVINYFDSNNNRQTLHYSYTESGGNGFYNKDGSAYSGGDKFVDQVIRP